MFASSKTALIAAFLAMPLFAAPQHLPLATGNTWTYRQQAGDETFTIRVGVPTLISDAVYYSLRGYTPKPLLVRFHEDGDLYYRDEDADRDVLLTSFQIVKEAWFQAPQRACDEEGQVDYTDPSVVSITYRTLSCADTGDQQEQFGANIGMLQRTVNTFIGPRRYELVSARVGSTSIQADAGAKLSVSVHRS